MAPACRHLAAQSRRGDAVIRRTAPGRRRAWEVLAGPLAVVLVAGCAALSQSTVSVDGASDMDPSRIARVSVDPDRPVLLRGVDSKLLPGVQVSSRLQVFTYVLPPGTHSLWLSSVP